MGIESIIGALLQCVCIVLVCAGATALILGPHPAGTLAAAPGIPRRTLWRCALWAVGSRVIVLLVMMALSAILKKTINPLELLNRWDAPHYLYIAEHGYTADQSLGDGYLFIVFFPLYPAILAALGRAMGGAYDLAGILASTLFLAGACVTLYRLAALDGDEGYARRAVVLLLAYPATFFLGMPYTESLFLLLSVLCLYWMRTQRWVAAGLAGLAAALTRNAGALLALPMAIEFLQAYSPARPQMGIPQPDDHAAPRADVWRALKSRAFWRVFGKKGWACALPPVGTALYLALNYKVYGDALMFLTIQREHWSQTMQPFYGSILTTWRGIAQGDAMNALFLWGPQLLMMLAILITLPVLLRRMRLSYGVYLLAFLLISFSPSWLLSFTRYMMGAVPLFLGLSSISRKRGVLTLLIGMSFALCMVMLTGFVLGYCVV